MLSWQTIYYYKTGFIFLNSILEMPSTLSVKSLLVVGFHTHTHTHTHTHRHTKFLLTEKKNSPKKCSWGLKTPKKLCKKFQSFFPYKFGGGGFWGVARGWKTIHFFLWPWPVTGQNSETVWLGGQKLSSGNLGGGRIKNKNYFLTKP